MKLAIACTLLSLLLLPPSIGLAQPTTSTYFTGASNYFVDSLGNTGIVFVDRFRDSNTGITTSELTYSRTRFAWRFRQPRVCEGPGPSPTAPSPGI